MTTIDRTEKIDSYLSGKMSPEEKKEFEGLLSADVESSNVETLREEMELQKDLITAIRERGLREQLKEQEQQMRARRAEKQRIYRLSGWSAGILSMAAVWCLVLSLVPVAQTMVRLSTDYVQSIVIAPARGGATDTPQTELEYIYTLLAQEQWVEAAPKAYALMEQTSVPSEELCEEERQEIYEQAQWLYTMCEMHQRHIFRAKRLLKQIAAGNGYYADQAKAMLKAM